MKSILNLNLFFKQKKNKTRSVSILLRVRHETEICTKKYGVENLVKRSVMSLRSTVRASHLSAVALPLCTQDHNDCIYLCHMKVRHFCVLLLTIRANGRIH
jgi:hypothetical protein